jgi:Berberine and berberine like/FAD binding domain
MVPITIGPQDPRYDTLVRGFNQRFVGEPAYVNVVDSAASAVDAVQMCLAAGLRPVVRSGGHCYEGWSSRTDGAIIDVSLMNACGRDSVSGGYVVESGATNWDIVNGLYRRFGVTLPAGSCYSVGAGGHISGGGYGLLSRLYGLTIDWLDEVELVTVRSGNAELVRVGRASPTQSERDLFWAHTGGGGGNFGLITKFIFHRLPPAPKTAWLATLAWNWSDLAQHRDQLEQIVTNFASFFQSRSGVALNAVTGAGRYDPLFAILHLRRIAGQQIVLTAQHTDDDRGPLDEFLAAMQHNVDPQRVPPARPLPGIAGHTLISGHSEVRQMPWLEVVQTENGSGANLRGKYKSAYMNDVFPARQIDSIWDWLTTVSADTPPNPLALLQIDSYGGRINTVASADTAIPQRQSIMKLQYQTYWATEEDDEKNLAWIRGFYNDMYGASGPTPDGVMDGCYVNYCDEDLSNWEGLYYQENYARLQKVKQDWDPRNVFHHSQSVRLPAS